MGRLATHPQTRERAKQLGLPTDGNCLKQIRRYARKKVDRLIEQFSDIETLDHLLRIVAGRLKVELVFLHTDEDVNTLGKKYPKAKWFAPRLGEVFFDSSTEGLLSPHPSNEPWGNEYIAVIDARGSRRYRAYFTAWHELTHVIVTPDIIGEAHRTPDMRDRNDPVERIVDDAASRLAFHEPFFQPALQEALGRERALSFRAIKRATSNLLGGEQEVPSPSLYASTRAAIRVLDFPVCFLKVEMKFKKRERERHQSPQIEMSFVPKPQRQLRIAHLYFNDAAESDLALRPNMRVPPDSILYQAHFDRIVPDELTALEDQCMWDTQADGALPQCPLQVCAIRRGSHTYGLLYNSRKG